MTAGAGGYVFSAEQTRELAAKGIRGRRAARPSPSMHFMRGPLSGALPELVKTIPPEACVSITETNSAPGKLRTMTITASWKEPE